MAVFSYLLLMVSWCHIWRTDGESVYLLLYSLLVLLNAKSIALPCTHFYVATQSSS